MAVLAGMMVPHPPLIIPEVGRGQERQIQDTINAYHKAAQTAAEYRPDTIVVISPHSVMYGDYFHVSQGKGAAGDFGQFQAPQVSVEARYDQEFVKALCRLAGEEGFPMGVEGERCRGLDHGTMIPLYFINQYYRDYMLVRLGVSGLSFMEHYRGGGLVARVAKALDRRTMIVASGDLSYKLREDGPYGFNPQGPEYDGKVMEVMGSAAFGKLLEFSPGFCEKAGECGHRSFLMMAGAMDKMAVETERLSYQGPFGVGYGVCVFRVKGADGSRHFLEEYEARKREECRKKRLSEDAYVSLARQSLERYVTKEEVLPLGQAAGELLPSMTAQKAGVFVSIHKDGALRGCIGTMGPVCENVAEEIIQNAISAGVRDPRFPPVKKEELPFLEYSVDVLGPVEAVGGMAELDARQYGVIVSKGRKRGLLLPNLEGVDTAEDQVAIAKQKAGIPEDDADVTLARFEVVRHGEK